MKLNTFWTKLNRNAPDNPGGAPTGDPPPVDPNAGNPPADPNAGDPPPVDPAPQEPTTPDLGWLPEEYRADGNPDIDGFKAHYEELVADKARRDEADGRIPDKYDFSLPADLDLGVELPDGVDIQLHTDNPLFEDFGSFLKENSISQDVAQGLVGLLAKYQAQQYAQLHTEATKEFETLGATESARDARVSTVKRALETKLPSDQAAALMAAVSSAAGVKALETILKPRGTTPTPTPKGAELEGLTAYERLKHANAQA